MSTNYRFFEAAPNDVFEVLSDGWLFPSWVVGASRIRDVHVDWPSVGTELHHSFGIWPAVIDDTTSITEWDPPRHAAFVARGWPLGEAAVVIDVKARKGGSFVRMQEWAISGPGTLVPDLAMNSILHLRNREALRRLAWIAEGKRRDLEAS